MSKYFIVYFHKGKTGFGVGQCETTTLKEINKLEDIQEIEENIKEENNFEEVVILNYKKLESR